MTQSENPLDPPARQVDPDLDAADRLVLVSPEDADTPRDFLLWAGVILLAVLTIFSKPVMSGSFLWDDDRYVEQNRNLRSPDGLVDIWTHFGLTQGGTIQYYPLTFTSFWIEYQIFGRGVWPPQQGSAFAVELRVTNLVLHALAAILLWFLLRQLGLPGSWLIAAIWAIHPLQTETVSWISERKNILCGVFYFGALLAYLRASGFRVRHPSDEQPRGSSGEFFAHPFYWLALALFLGAMLSKTVACTMPAVALVLLWWKRGRLRAGEILGTVPFFVIGIGLSLLTAHIETAMPIAGGVGAVGQEWDLNWMQRLLIAGRAVWFYAWKNLWPVNLSFIYPRWNVDPHLAWQWAFPAAVIVVLAALLLLRKWIGRGPFAAAAIFVGSLVPALGFVNFYPMKYSFVADHFQYLAAPALIALVVVIVARLLRPGGPIAGYVASAIVLIPLAVLSVMQSGIYIGQVALWQDTAAKNPTSPIAHYNYGLSLAHAADDFQAGQMAAAADATRTQAYAQFQNAVELKPSHDHAWQEMGLTLLERNKPQESIAKFDRALSINPGNLEAMMGRGAAFHRLKQYDNSLAAYRQALDYAEQHKQEVSRVKAAAIFQGIGNNLQAKGDLKAAADNYTRAAQIEPGMIAVRLDLAKVLNQLGDKPASAKAYADVIIDQPENIDARLGLASLMLDVGNLVGAQTQLVAAARIDRDNPRLMTEAKRFDALYRKEEAATRPTSGPATLSTTGGSDLHAPEAKTGATSAPSGR